MTKYLIISDSHQDNKTLENILKQHADIPIIHAGDSCLEKDDPILKNVLVVKGNHDFVDFDEYIIFPPYFICHGHTFGVYYSFENMINMAKKYNCHTIIHGHTHIPYDEIHDDIRIINPGSSMINRGSYGFGTYAILDNDYLTFYHHQTHEMVNDIVIPDGKKTLNEFRDLIKQFKL